MAHQWYYTRGSEKLGPFTARQLKDLADAGEIVPTDTIWRDGFEQGVSAARVEHLFSAVQLQAVATVSAMADSVSAPGHTHHAGEIQGAGPEDSGLVAADPVTETLANLPGEPTTPAEQKPAAPTVPPGTVPEKPKTGRAMAIKGAIIVSQDGVALQYRKVCVKCGHQDASKARMQIRNGVTRVTFFCPKCRKLGPVEIQGMM